VRATAARERHDGKLAAKEIEQVTRLGGRRPVFGVV
jgi:hypothetical protein